MPPWLPSSSGAPLRHARTLDSRDRQSLVDWLARGALSAPSSSAPALSASALSVQMPPAEEPHPMSMTIADEWSVNADPGMILRSFAVAQPETPPLLVSAIEMAAEVPGVVHQVSLLWDTHGYGVRLDRGDPAPGYDAVGDIGFSASGVAGSISRLMPRFELPAGYALRIPDCATLIAEVHAEGRGKVESPTVTLKFFPPASPVRVLSAISFSGVRGAVVTADCSAIAISIRAGSRVQSLQAVSVDHTGIERILLDIPKWNERFVEMWIFDSKQRLAAGSNLVVRSTINADAAQIPLDDHAAAMSIPTVVVLVAEDATPLESACEPSRE